MHIPIFKLPYVVQRELLSHFSSPCRLYLSMCSSRATVLVQSIVKFKVKRVVIFDTLGMFIVVLENFKETYEQMVHFVIYPNLREHLKEVGKKGFSTRLGFFKSMTSTSQPHSRHLAFEETELSEIQKSISSHMMALSQPGTDLQIHIEKKPPRKFSLPNFVGVTETVVDGDFLTASLIEEVVKKYPGQQCLSLQTIYGDVEKNSEIFNVPNVSIQNAGHVAGSFIRNFNGKHLKLEKASFSGPRVVKFLENWKNGSGYQNLENIILTLHNGYRFNEEEVLERFRQDQPTVPKEYHYSSKFSKNKTFNCENAVNIKRASDGKVASVLIGPWEFKFLVWNERTRS